MTLEERQHIRIFKYPLEVGWRQRISMPVGAVILSCGVQREQICLWARVDTGAPSEERVFHIYGTGNMADASVECAFIGTVSLQTGTLVLHVFEEPSKTVEGL